MEIMLKFAGYSVLGCSLEVLWGLIREKKLKSRRMLLNLPMCPVYGIGGVVLSKLLTGFKGNTAALFVFGALAASAVELLYYALCVKIFSVRVWDYSSKKANLLGGICFEYTLWWGLLSVAFAEFIDPVADIIIGAMPIYTQFLAVVFVGLITAADINKTAKLLLRYKSGKETVLPKCFWYMRKCE